MGVMGDLGLPAEVRKNRPAGWWLHKPRSRPCKDRGTFRSDIEGLRAVAVLAVLLYHAGVPFLPGGFIGVDVFFVISGFLITSLLVKELTSDGGISLSRFYARRARRLLPAAAVVLVFVTAATALLLPRTRWMSTAWDLVASSLYGINWRLAAQSVDYFAANESPGMVQHFWSLAVEEQFYLIWPLLLLLATRWTRPRVGGRYDSHHDRLSGRSLLSPRQSHDHTRARPLSPSLYLCLAMVAVPSLAWSIQLTATDPGPAYFVSTARMWELCIGGGIAIGAARLAVIPHRIAAAIGWAGLASVLATALILTAASPFPGAVALVPTLGTAAVIASGQAAGRSGPVRVLGLAPMRWIGGLSYSLYLWHWPLVVLATTKLGTSLTLPLGLAVVLATFVPAYLSYRYVEEPVRRAQHLVARPKVAMRLGLVCTLVGVFSGSALLVAVWVATPPPSLFAARVLTSGGDLAAGAPRFGAEVLRPLPLGDPSGAATHRVASMVPDVLNAARDLDSDCDITSQEGTQVMTCARGNSGSRLRVLLLGDSHAQQWMPALEAIAKAENWDVVAHLKAACPFIQGEVSNRNRPYASCIEWNRKVRQALPTEARPDLVILTNRKVQMSENGRVLTGPAGSAKVSDALRAAVREFTDAGVPVAVIRDPPTPGVDIPECIASHPTNLTACAPPRSGALRGFEQLTAVRGVERAHILDLSDAICPGDPCAPVIGGVMLWRDDQHLTRTYVLSLTPRLQALLRPLTNQR